MTVELSGVWLYDYTGRGQKMVTAILLGYALGSIPFGFILVRLVVEKDIRAIGSGSIGATNVLRIGRKDIALATLLLDGVKGLVAILLARYFLSVTAIPVAGAAAFVGHIFPVWLSFKGGKGVATSFGLWLGLSWPVGVVALVLWLIVAVAFRFSSVASLTAVISLPLSAWLFGEVSGHVILAIGMMILVIFRHRENIYRLWEGAEPRISYKGTRSD